MAVGASLFAHLTSNNPLDAYAKGAAIRQQFDNAAQQQQAQGFHFLLGVLQQQQQERQHNDTINLGMAKLAEEARYHDRRLQQLGTGANAFQVPQSGDLGGGMPQTPAGPPAQPSTDVPQYGTRRIGIPDEASLARANKDFEDMTADFVKESGGAGPLKVRANPEQFDERLQDRALELLIHQKKLHDLATGQEYNQAPYLQELARSQGINPNDPEVLNPRRPAIPDRTSTMDLPTVGPGVQTSQILPPLDSTVPGASPKFAGTVTTQKRTERPVGGSGPTQSTDPFDWSNIKEGGNGYRQVAADGSGAIVRRKSGGVMLEQKIDYVRGAKGLREVTHPERVVTPAFMTDKPSASWLPTEKMDALNMIKFWQDRIYRGMGVKEKAQNEQLALQLEQKKIDLLNDPEVQSKLNTVEAAEMKPPPGMVVSGTHYSDKLGKQVASFRRAQPGEIDGMKQKRSELKDAWANFTKLSTAAKNAPIDMQEVLDAQTAKALQRLMKIDPLFGTLNGVDAGAAGDVSAPSGGGESTASKVDQLSKIILGK